MTQIGTDTRKPAKHCAVNKIKNVKQPVCRQFSVLELEVLLRRSEEEISVEVLLLAVAVERQLHPGVAVVEEHLLEPCIPQPIKIFTSIC